MIFPAILLAGGKSKRMGEDKSQIEIEGKPMIIHAIKNLKMAGCSEILIQTKKNNVELKSILSDFEIIWNYDNYDDGDVLRAILSALTFANNKNWDAVQLMPVDTPFISQILLKNLSNLLDENLDVVLPSSTPKKNTKSNGLEPLLACLKVKPTIKKINENLENNKGLGKILSEMKCLIVDEEIWSRWGVSEESFKNINYPNDRE